MRAKICYYVRETMKNYGVRDKKLEKEISEACLDEYNMQVESGAEEDAAFGAAVSSVDGIIKGMIKPRNKYSFALGMGILALCVSVLEMFCSLLARAVYFYNAEMIVAAAGFAVIAVVYAVVARREGYRWYNFLILGILVASWLVSFFLLFPSFFFDYTPGSYQKLNFIFPCLFEIRVHRDWMADGEYVKSFVFYPDFLVSVAIFASSLALYVKQKSKLGRLKAKGAE